MDEKRIIKDVFFPHLSKWLEAMRFRVIRYNFDKIPVHDLCYLLLCGWLQGVILVECQNRFEGGVLGSFSIDLMDFRTIIFFTLIFGGG